MMIVLTVMVIFTTLGVLNIIVGVIVERTTGVMRRQLEEDEAAFKAKQEELIWELSSCFDTFDVDGNSRLSWNELERASGESSLDLGQILEEINFPPGIKFKEIFQMLDANGDGVLSKAEFIRGLFRIVHCNEFQRDCLMFMSVGRNMSSQIRAKKS